MAGGLTAMEELLEGTELRKRLLAAGAHEIPLNSGMVALTPRAGCGAGDGPARPC